MMIKFALFLGVLTLINATPVQKCAGNPDNLFKNVTISTSKGVCTKLPCNLYSGEDVEAIIEFSPTKEVDYFKILCKAKVMGMNLNYPIPGGEHGCNFLTNTKCPIKPNFDTVMTVKMRILPSVPKVPVDLQIYSEDQNNEIINCFKFSGRVV